MSSLGDDISSNLMNMALKKRQAQKNSPTPSYGTGEFSGAEASTFPSPGPSQMPSDSESMADYTKRVLKSKQGKFK